MVAWSRLDLELELSLCRWLVVKASGYIDGWLMMGISVIVEEKKKKKKKNYSSSSE